MSEASAGLGSYPLASTTKALGTASRSSVRCWYDRRLGHGRVLDQHAFQLERTDPVVAGLEHVVGTAHVGDEPVLIPGGDVASVVTVTCEGVCVPLVVALITHHQPNRTLGFTFDADFALVGDRFR